MEGEKDPKTGNRKVKRLAEKNRDGSARKRFRPSLLPGLALGMIAVLLLAGCEDSCKPAVTEEHAVELSRKHLQSINLDALKIGSEIEKNLEKQLIRHEIDESIFRSLFDTSTKGSGVITCGDPGSFYLVETEDGVTEVGWYKFVRGNCAGCWNFLRLISYVSSCGRVRVGPFRKDEDSFFLKNNCQPGISR